MSSSTDLTNSQHYLDARWAVKTKDYKINPTPDLKPTEAPPGYRAMTAVDSSGKVLLKCIFVCDPDTGYSEERDSAYEYMRDRLSRHDPVWVRWVADLLVEECELPEEFGSEWWQEKGLTDA